MAPPLGLIKHRVIISIKPRPCPAVATRTSGILAEPSSTLVLFASSSSAPARPMTSTMEAPVMLENGNAPLNRRSTCLQVPFYSLVFVLIIISTLVSIVFCLLQHNQAAGSCWAHGSFKESFTEGSELMSWDWKLEHCTGIVRDQGQYLIIEQSGRYFIYAQLFRKKTIKEPLTLMLCKDPQIPLNNAVRHENGTVNFGRLFFLQKGDKLYCQKNDSHDKILLSDQTYWGLFKM